MNGSHGGYPVLQVLFHPAAQVTVQVTLTEQPHMDCVPQFRNIETKPPPRVRTLPLMTQVGDNP